MSMTDGEPMMAGTQLTLGLDREPAAWNVRRSPRARRLSVRVYPGGRVEVVVPRGVGARLVQRFVVGHRAWITRKVDEMRAFAPVDADRLPGEIHVAAVNEQWVVRHGAGAAGDHAIETRPERSLALPSGDERRARRWLQSWLRARARAVLEPWLIEVAREIDIGFERLEIRRQRTRWGSCSRNGTISLNACLLFQRAEVVRYLLVHELCHRHHMNHSRRFWALVARHEPGFRALDAELSQGWRRVPDWVFRDLGTP
jgi:predicted metal-dependent hydrolase